MGFSGAVGFSYGKSESNATQDNENGIRTIPKESAVPNGNFRQQMAQLRHQTENLKKLNHGPGDNANVAKKLWERFGIFGNTTSILGFTPASRSRQRLEFLR